MHENSLRYKELISYSNIWKVSYPIILGGIAQTLINITDSAFLGRVSEVALGASAIAGLFYVTLMMLGYGFCIGTQIIIAKYDGENRQKEMGKVLDHTIYSMMILSAVVFLFLQLLGPFLLKFFVQSEAVLNASLDFLQFRSFGVFFAFLIFALRAFFTGISQTKIVVYTTIIMAASNIILNYLLVFGNHGFPRMETAGSALSSSLAEFIAFIFAVFYTIKKVKRKQYQLFEFKQFNLGLVKEIFTIAVPIMFQVFIALCSWFIFFMIVEKLGERSLAISNLIRNCYMILMIPLMGFSSATNTLVSNLNGQKQIAHLFSLLKRIIGLSMICTATLAILALLIPKIMLGIFTDDLQLIEATIPSLHVILGSLMMYSAVGILLSAVSGTGKTMLSLIIEFLTILFYLFATYLAAIKWQLSIEWVWSVEYVYFSFLGALSIYFLFKIKAGLAQEYIIRQINS
jgi:putative MATE family efflux protein